MKITFPHIGQVFIPATLVLKELGISFILPPENSPVALERGKTVSPEDMCLPFKLMAGNLIQAYEKGAEMVLMPATMGPCRLGEYGELLRQVLDKAGYKMKWVLMDSPKAIGFTEWVHRLNYVGRDRKTTIAESCSILVRGVLLMRKIDAVEAELKRIAGYARDSGDCIRLLRRFRQEMRGKNSLKEGFSAVKACEYALKKIPLDEKKDPVRVLITGEIYTSIEDVANQNLEELVMRMGCSIRRPVTISWWMGHTIKATFPKIRKKSESCLPFGIGGYAKETVEEICRSEEDGIIKIMPSGCMPEIVAKAACNVLEEKQDKRILHLIYDEMQAGAGYETRIEAFIDMLERRKRVFPGN